MIFNLFLVTMVFFFKLNQNPTFFSYNITFRRLSPSNVCPSPDFCNSPTFVSPIFVRVRRLSRSDVCASPKFVPVRRLNCHEFDLIKMTSFFYVYLLSSFSPPPSPYSSSSSSLSPFFPGSFVESWVV